MTLDCPPVDAERSGKRLDRGEEALLKPGDQEGRRRLRPLRRAAEAFLAKLPVSVEQFRESQLGGLGRESVEVDLPDDPRGEAPFDRSQILLQATDHHVVEQFPATDRDAAAEPLGVQDLQEGGEAVGVTVVRGGREKQPVLEPPG